MPPEEETLYPLEALYPSEALYPNWALVAFSVKEWWKGVLPAAEKKRERAYLTIEDIEGIEKRIAEFVENGLQLKEAANSKFGVSAALVAGKLVVANTSVTANSKIFLTRQAGGTHAGAVYVSAKTAATSFEITSTNAEDTGTVAYNIVEPA